LSDAYGANLGIEVDEVDGASEFWRDRECSQSSHSCARRVRSFGIVKNERAALIAELMRVAKRVGQKNRFHAKARRIPKAILGVFSLARQFSLSPLIA
jgi:hypothetical protein